MISKYCCKCKCSLKYIILLLNVLCLIILVSAILYISYYWAKDLDDASNILIILYYPDYWTIGIDWDQYQFGISFIFIIISCFSAFTCMFIVINENDQPKKKKQDENVPYYEL